MDILTQLADNQALQDAFKELLKAEFETPLSEVDQLADAEIGQKVRARLYGKRAIENAFMKLAKHKTNKGSLRGENPAR
jgi:hypothetical protein